jgi:hypothetical protein
MECQLIDLSLASLVRIGEINWTALESLINAGFLIYDTTQYMANYNEKWQI